MRRAGFLILAFFAAAACTRTEEAIVVRIGKSAITESEFQRKLEEVAPDYQNYVQTPHGRKQFLDVLVREELILQASRSNGVASSPEFQERMRTLRKEEERKLDEARDYLLKRLWLEKLRKQGILQVTDEDVSDFHRKHPEEVVVRHVLLPTPEEAEATLRVIRGGASFAEVAKKSSLDADTAVTGGQMPPALHGEIIPELEVVFEMRIGEVGGPVRSSFGYHVILKEQERKVELSQVQERIRGILEKEKLDQHLKTLQASFPVEVVDAQFKSR